VLDVPALAVVERDPGEKAPHLRRVVVLDRRFQMLAERRRLAELAAEPPQERDVRGLHGDIMLVGGRVRERPRRSRPRGRQS